MRFALAAIVAVLCLIPASTARVTVAPQDDPPAQDKDKDTVKMDEETRKAVDRALEWMKGEQQRDGSWGNTAITSFALLAFMANGHVPNQGTYGDVVSKGVRYLLACVRDKQGARDDGYLVGDRGGNMYCHGMATLALTQVYGMTGDKEVRDVLKKAVELIIRSQSREGGWRYDPHPDAGADISVTIMEVMALRGAKDSGLHVPDKVFDDALAYIARCRDGTSGGYRYQPFSRGAGYARTAAGVCVLQLCGKYDAEEIKAAVDYMVRVGDDGQHYWYGHYYACHALNQVGGKVWEEYYDRMKTTLLTRQRPSGEWYESRREAAYGPVYQTAIAVLILSVPTHYLPIYQK